MLIITFQHFNETCVDRWEDAISGVILLLNIQCLGINPAG